MKNKNLLDLGRIIGKIDNDFNISESDWIPRVAAWVTDALSQMKVLPMTKKRRTLEVSDKIAQFPCQLSTTDIKVYDHNGCEIPELDNNFCNCSKHNSYNSQEIAIIDTTNKSGVNFMQIGNVINGQNKGHNYVIQGNNIELNFDTDKIIVDSYEVMTYYDEYYDCEVPYVYDDGLLLEALAWYCLFKYLSRGSKHPVYDLKSNSPVTNPFIQWNNLKSKAAASVKIKLNKDKGWNNFFYNSTFTPRS